MTSIPNPSTERDLVSIRRLFRLAALSNFAVTVPAFVSYRRYVAMFTKEPPNYPFLVWIWSGMAFLWGVCFWEISRDPVAKKDLVKYAYLEKSITTTSVGVAFARKNIPGKFFVSILFTDLMWIPMFAWADRKLHRRD